jgi:hypothetical protein
MINAIISAYTGLSVSIKCIRGSSLLLVDEQGAVSKHVISR